MNALARALSAEALKLRGTLAMWMCLIAPAVVVGLYVLQITFRDIPARPNIDPATAWQGFAYSAFGLWAFLMLPLFVTLQSALLAGLEHGERQWKHLLALPLPRATHYFAKAIALLAVHPGDILEYAWDHPQERPIERTLPWFVALPTTAGTGSEVGRSSVISDDVTHVKKIVFSPALLARAVYADPELTLGLPPAITAATGMDALTHNVESYLSPAYHPLCDGIALEGTRIAARALPRAVADGRDLAARSDMLMSSMMGAIAFQKDLGAVHSCAHALSTVADMHHGLANGIMIDHVMRFNLPAATAKMAELAHVAGVPGGDTGTAEARALAFVAWLAKLKADLRIPAQLSGYAGPRPVARADVPRLVEIAVADICHQTNPRKCTAADFEALFAAAL